MFNNWLNRLLFEKHRPGSLLVFVPEPLVCAVTAGIIPDCFRRLMLTKLRSSCFKPLARIALIALLMSTIPLGFSDSAGDIQAGETKAYTCTGCHGIPGYNNIYPTYKVPKIGGQNYAYLVAALKAYKNGERDHATMELQASSLNDADIEDISAYFASLGKG